MSLFFPSKDEVSLYFHIPFCTKKCSYCHFYVVIDNKNQQAVLMEGFHKEWNALSEKLKGKTLTSIYFGGGTPSLMSSEDIYHLIQLTKNSFNQFHPSLEITLEANPETIDFATMSAFHQAGVNRVSIGIQTLDNGILPFLGRQHTAEKAITAVENTYNAGIENISIDLMYDLPHQTLTSWQKSIKAIETLPVTHLSLYNMTIEPHTQFYKQRETIKAVLPDETTSLHMYQTAVDLLQQFGLKQYEISAFAKNNRFSLHNTGYWTGRSFLGLGPSAFSYWQGKRYHNIAHLKKWYDALTTHVSPVDFCEELGQSEKIRELLAIRLRLLEGINLRSFESHIGSLDEETIKTIDSLISENYLTKQDGYLSLTPKGVLFYDNVASEII